MRQMGLGRIFVLAMWGLLSACAAAHAEGGCPAGKFPDALNHKCVSRFARSPLPLSDDDPMQFEVIRLSAAISWIQATGIITTETPSVFKQFLTRNGRPGLPDTIYLHSRGGNLMAGLQLGEMIRKNDFNTQIGRTIDLEGGFTYGTVHIQEPYEYPVAYCMSACAYAFLGGASRSYSSKDIYGIHRFGVRKGTVSGDEAQLISSFVAKYIQDMGVDLSVFELASETDFEHDIYRVPTDLAKKMKIIYDPSGITQFIIEYRNGSAIAKFDVSERERRLSGAIVCSPQGPVLMIFDRTYRIPDDFEAVRNFPAEFKSGKKILNGRASYARPEGRSPAVMEFLIPDLRADDFLGQGLSLDMIWNLNLPSPGNRTMSADEFARRSRWVDLVDAYFFRISAQTLWTRSRLSCESAFDSRCSARKAAWTHSRSVSGPPGCFQRAKMALAWRLPGVTVTAHSFGSQTVPNRGHGDTITRAPPASARPPSSPAVPTVCTVGMSPASWVRQPMLPAAIRSGRVAAMLPSLRSRRRAEISGCIML